MKLEFNHLFYRKCFLLQAQPILEAFLTGWVALLSYYCPLWLTFLIHHIRYTNIPTYHVPILIHRCQVGESALAQWHLRNTSSLRGCIFYFIIFHLFYNFLPFFIIFFIFFYLGCINNFFMDDKSIDFLQAAHRRPGVLAGCYQR